ncbi:Uncharacterised protein [Halioglobus japonicus]|nr:Uncharacterised protein [Halioglobus japonicus]
MVSYLKYLFIGAVVGIASIIGREIIAVFLPADTPEYYALSVFIVYALGILASYTGHRKVSFSHVDMEGQSTASSMTWFTVIAVVGLLCATVLSVCIRYLLPIQGVFGAYSATAAFAIATVITSVITFTLNARHTFRGSTPNVL